MQAIITDIEGTTTSIRFVFDVLFPYARENLGAFIEQHAQQPEVAECLAEVVAIAGIPADTQSINRQLIQWIDDDQKITPLKTLQGMIWQRGYEQGDFTGHVYADVEPALRRWHQAGVKLYVYSSGSVAAQQLLFAYSDVGDLTSLFSGYFDTRTGNKRESTAYQNILKTIECEAAKVLFLSDIEAELDAAKAVGINTVQLIRDDNPASENHRAVSDFSQININT